MHCAVPGKEYFLQSSIKKHKEIDATGDVQIGKPSDRERRENRANRTSVSGVHTANDCQSEG